MFAFYRRVRPRRNEFRHQPTSSIAVNAKPPPSASLPRSRWIAPSLCIDTTSKQPTEAAGIAPTTCHATNSIILDIGWMYIHATLLSNLPVYSSSLFPFVVFPAPLGDIRTRSASNGSFKTVHYGLNHPPKDDELRGWHGAVDKRRQVSGIWFCRSYVNIDELARKCSE